MLLRVARSRPQTYKITMELNELSDAAWKKAIDGSGQEGAILRGASRRADAEGDRPIRARTEQRLSIRERPVVRSAADRAITLRRAAQTD